MLKSAPAWRDLRCTQGVPLSLLSAAPLPAFSDATVLNCASFFVSFFQRIAFSASQEKCLAWPGKNNIVHALPRLAEEDSSARAAFLSPDNSGGTLIFC
jgi:hypothetical protein